MAKVLIVDDEVGIRELLREILEDEGYAVETAENGLQANERLEAERPDVILLDIWMPDVDGITLLRQWMGRQPPAPPVTSGRTPARQYRCVSFPRSLHSGGNVGLDFQGHIGCALNHGR